MPGVIVAPRSATTRRCAADGVELKVLFTALTIGPLMKAGHSGMVRQHQTRNLEIPGSMRCIAPE
jgi:hypothetical protein